MSTPGDFSIQATDGKARAATLVRSVGQLMATYPDLLELDLNPVLTRQEGCVAADFRAVVARAISH